MKKLSICLFAIALVNLAFAQSKNFDVSDFTGISLSSAANVELSKGSAHSVTATGSESALNKLDIRVEKNSLKIGRKKGVKWSKEDGKVKIKVTAPKISAIAISGSGDLNIMGDFNTDKFAVSVSGSGDISCLGSVTCSKMAVQASGSADVQLKGSAKNLAITNSGSSDISMSNFKAEDTAIVNSGSGDIETNASAKVSIVNSGSGDINIGGNPDKKSIINTGSGDIDYK